MDVSESDCESDVCRSCRTDPEILIHSSNISMSMDRSAKMLLMDQSNNPNGNFFPHDCLSKFVLTLNISTSYHVI